jgi:hypothetical protein
MNKVNDSQSRIANYTAHSLSLLKMDLVAVDEDSTKWKAMYVRMSRGEKADINDKLLSTEPVDGLPANLTGQDGQLQVPREAGNINPGAPVTTDIPIAYNDAAVMKPRTTLRASAKKGRKSGTKKKKTTSKSRPRKSGGGVKKRRAQRSKGRRRSRIVSRK